MQNKQEQLQTFLSKLENNNFFRKAIINQNKCFDISPQELIKITPKDIKHLREYILNKSNSDKHQNNSNYDQWTEPQKRLFIWILLCFLQYHSKTANLLTETDLQKISDFTTNRPIPEIKYYVHAFENQTKRPKWTEQEDRILHEILFVQKKYPVIGRWSCISKELFLRGGHQLYKSGKNCRERWYNHVNPEISKNWSIEEDLKLMNFVKNEGKKWAKMVPQLNNTKSEHMIKNRFNSLIRKIENQSNLKLKENERINLIISKLTADLSRQQQLKKKQQKSSSRVEQNQSKRLTRSNSIKSAGELKELKSPDCRLKQPTFEFDFKQKNEQIQSEPYQDNMMQDEKLKFLFERNIIKQEEIDGHFNDFKLNQSMKFNLTSPIPPTPFQFSSGNFKNLSFNVNNFLPRLN